MPCNLAAVSGDLVLDCADIPVGGIVKAMVAYFNDVSLYTEVDGEITAMTIAQDKVIDLEFNNKDGFSNFTDEKTVDDTGIVSAVPTVALEFPKMTLAKRNALEKLSSPGVDLVLFIETSAGERHCAGLDFGMQGTTVNGKTGTGRAEKNTYDIAFTGEETNLARLVSSDVWTELIDKTKPVA